MVWHNYLENRAHVRIFIFIYRCLFICFYFSAQHLSIEEATVTYTANKWAAMTPSQSISNARDDAISTSSGVVLCFLQWLFVFKQHIATTGTFKLQGFFKRPMFKDLVIFKKLSLACTESNSCTLQLLEIEFSLSLVNGYHKIGSTASPRLVVSCSGWSGPIFIGMWYQHLFVLLFRVQKLFSICRHWIIRGVPASGTG